MLFDKVDSGSCCWPPSLNFCLCFRPQLDLYKDPFSWWLNLHSDPWLRSVPAVMCYAGNEWHSCLQNSCCSLTLVVFGDILACLTIKKSRSDNYRNIIVETSYSSQMSLWKHDWHLNLLDPYKILSHPCGINWRMRQTDPGEMIPLYRSQVTCQPGEMSGDVSAIITLESS